MEGGGEALQPGQGQQGATPQAPNTTPQDQTANQQGQGETAKTLDAATQYEKFTVPEISALVSAVTSAMRCISIASK